MLRFVNRISAHIGRNWRIAARCYSASSSSAEAAVVNSYNEWDPLEEVIVGRAEGQRVPSLDSIKGMIPREFWGWIAENAGKPHDPDVVQKAEKEVDEFCRVLQQEGVTVRRPEPIRWDQLGTFRTPYFEEGGLMNACPRDGLLVVGDELIETAMTWRSRMFDSYPYKKLFMEYFRRGARWTSAPKSTMGDHLYVKDFPYENDAKREEMAADGQFFLTEEEPSIDGASTVRFGRDIFVEISTATNRTGIEWLRRHLAPRGINVHSFIYKGTVNCHADVILVPLKPGLALINPKAPCLKVNDEPTGWEYFRKRGWDLIEAPPPILVEDSVMVSKWIHMNTLSLDTERVVIQRGEEPLKRLLTDRLGLKTIELEMRNAYQLGGGFHCWTLDVRRRGELQSYF